MNLLGAISEIQLEILNWLRLKLFGLLDNDAVRAKLDMSDIPEDGRCVAVSLQASGPYQGLPDAAPLQTAALQITILTHLMEDLNGGECAMLSNAVQDALRGYLPAGRNAEAIHLMTERVGGPDILDSFRVVVIDYQLIIEIIDNQED